MVCCRAWAMEKFLDVWYLLIVCGIVYSLGCGFGMVVVISAVAESDLLIQPVDLGRK